MPACRALVGIALLVWGYSIAAAQQQIIVAPNNLFTAAGFIVKYATTPEKRAMLRSLPPDKLVKRTKNGITYYVYADAARCNCAYVGTVQAYAVYQNAPNDPTAGGQESIVRQLIDSDATPYIPEDSMTPGIEGILHPEF